MKIKVDPRSSLFFSLFFTPVVAAFLPYLACSMLDVPLVHGMFSIDMFILLCLLLTPRKNVIWFSIWSLLLVLFAFFYEQSFHMTVSMAHYSQWSDYFCAFVYLIVIFSAFVIPRKIKFVLPLIGFFYLLLFLADASNILHLNFNIKLIELWRLASFFIWGIALFIAVPCLQVALVLFFSRKIFLNYGNNFKLPPSLFILLFLFVLILNWGVNSLQNRERIVSFMLKEYSFIFDKEEMPSRNRFLSPDFKAAYPIHEKNDLLTVNDKYDKVVMILVESWGIPKNIALLQASFQIFEDIPNTFLGLYSRNAAYTQGAEWEDFGIPEGEIKDSVLPMKYKAAGYETWYVHGFDKDFFDRAEIYPTYGFDSLLFRDDFSKKGLKWCRYGYPGICDESLEHWLEHKIDEPGKKFIYWTTLDAHFPYDSQIFEKKSKLCDEFNLSKLACVFWTHEEETLQSVARLVKRFPNVRFVIRGDHRPMGKTNYTEFLESFYAFWVPIITVN